MFSMIKYYNECVQVISEHGQKYVSFTMNTQKLTKYTVIFAHFLRDQKNILNFHLYFFLCLVKYINLMVLYVPEKIKM